MLYLTKKIEKEEIIKEENTKKPKEITSIFDAIEYYNQSNSVQSFLLKEVKIIELPEYKISENYKKLINTNLKEIKQVIEFFLKHIPKEYYQFSIPKATGGLRQISAPKTEALKKSLNTIAHLMKNKLHVYEHKAAYAYIEKKSTLQMLQQHQKNNSNFYLKIDIKNFFPSCTKEVISKALKKIYPLNELLKEKEFEEAFLEYITLDGKLPQGSPLSPYLSNLILIEQDLKIQELLKQSKHFKKQRYVYTRYADDIIISAKKGWNYKTMEKYIADVLNPFRIKTEKTRYGSKAGRNWNVGLMLNKDNQITIGHRRKKQIRASLWNLLTLTKTNSKAEVMQQAQAVNGNLAYWNYINPGEIKQMFENYSNKLGINTYEKLKSYLKGDF